jgi:ribosomal protein S27E
MNQKPMAMNIANMVRATETAKSKIASVVELAEKMIKDPQKAGRLAAQECKACHYSSRIGGCAMTTRPCMSCGEDQMYGSTNTDVLCLSCAKKHKLCKHCGGDLDIRTRRREWPKRGNET